MSLCRLPTSSQPHTYLVLAWSCVESAEEERKASICWSHVEVTAIQTISYVITHRPSNRSSSSQVHGRHRGYPGLRPCPHNTGTFRFDTQHGQTLGHATDTQDYQ